MEQISVAIAELQGQVASLSGTVSNLETMRRQLGEIDLPGLVVKVQELLNMREQLGTDLPGLVNTVRELHAANERRQTDRFTTDDRPRKPINEQRENVGVA